MYNWKPQKKAKWYRKKFWRNNGRNFPKFGGKKKNTKILDPVGLVTMEIREYFELNDNKTQPVKCVRYS